MGFQPQLFKGIRRLKPQQAAAHHHAARGVLRAFADGVKIVKRAVDETARQVAPRYGRDKRPGAGGEHQLVEMRLVALRVAHDLPRAIQRHNLATGTQFDARLREKIALHHRERLRAAPREILRKMHAIVGRVALFAKDDDMKALMQPGADALLQKMVPYHAVAHDHQSLFCHRVISCSRGLRFIGFIKQQPGAGAQRLPEVIHQRAGAVGIAIQQHAGEPAVIDNQAAIVAGYWVEAYQRLGLRAGRYLARAEDGDTGDFEPRAFFFITKARRLAAEPRRQHVRLLQTGCHQPPGLRVDFAALADGAHRRVRGAKRVIHHNAALASEPGGLRQRDSRSHAGGDHHPLRRDDFAAGERDVIGRNARNAAAGHHANVARAQAFGEPLARLRIQLLLHQPRVTMHQRHRRALSGKRRGRFHPKQAAAQHHGGAGRREKRPDIRQRAKGAYVRQLAAFNRRNKRRRAGGKHQFIPGQRARRGGDGARSQIHRQRPLTG